MNELTMRRTRSVAQAVTLVEILVVLGVIGVLAGLLLPVLLSARESARITTCLSNERQLGLAFQLYRSDWNALPEDFADLRRGRWFSDPLQPYTLNSEIYHCPDTPNRKVARDYLYRVSSFLHLAAPKLLIPDSNTVLLYCLNHAHPAGAENATGIYVALRDQGSVHRIAAGKVQIWQFMDGKWLPPGPPVLGASIWPVFPDENWPPAWQDAN
jgi:type II secretory pathway pseudopilin PulG